MQFFAVLLSTVALAVSTIATPLHVAERSELIVFDPTVTVPTPGSIWTSGDLEYICIDANPPAPAGATTTIYLGHPDGNSENLFTDPPLAQDFMYTDGCAVVTVPYVPPGDGYWIYGLGDSASGTGPITINSW